MPPQTLLDQVRKTIAVELGIDSQVLKLDSGLGLIQAWDSLAHVKIIVALEREHRIMFEFDELDKLDTVERLVSSIEKHALNR